MGKQNANDILKRYTIEIDASTKKATEQIDAVSKSLKNLADKNDTDVLREDFSKVTKTLEGLQGAVKQASQSITKGFSDINNGLKAMNPDSFTKSVDESIQKIAALQESLSSFESNKAFSGAFKHITDSLHDMSVTVSQAVDEMKTASGVLTNIKIGAIDPSSFRDSFEEVQKFEKEFQQVISNLAAELEDLEDVSGINLFATGSDAIKKASKEQLKAYKDYIDAMIEAAKNARGHGVNVGSVFLETFNISESEIKEIQTAVQNQIKALKNDVQKKTSKKQQKVDTYITLDVKPDVSQDKINDIIGAIRNNIITKVNEGLKGSPVLIPIGYSADTSNVTDIKEKEKLEKLSSDKSVIRSLNLQVTADTKNLKKQVDDEIKTLNLMYQKPDAPKIKLDVIGEIDEESIRKKAQEFASIANEERDLSLGLTSNANLKITNDSGIATEGTLSTIKDILSNWNSNGIISTINGTSSSGETSKVSDMPNGFVPSKQALSTLRKYSMFGRSPLNNYSAEGGIYDTRAQLAESIQRLQNFNNILATTSSQLRSGGLEKSELYNASFEKDGKTYSLYGNINGKIAELDAWQNYLKKSFEAGLLTKDLRQYVKDSLKSSNFDAEKYKAVNGLDQKEFTEDIKKLHEVVLKTIDSAAGNQDLLKEKLRELFLHYQKTISNMVESVASEYFNVGYNKNTTDKELKYLVGLGAASGVEFIRNKRKTNGGNLVEYGDYYMASRSTTAFSAEEEANTINMVVQKSKEQLEELSKQQVALERQRYIAQQILKDEATEDELLELKTSAMRIAGDNLDEIVQNYEKLNQLEEERTRLESKLQNQGLTTPEAKRLSDIPKEIDGLFVQVEDIVKYAQDKLTNAETGFDSMIAEINEQRQEIVARTRREANLIANQSSVSVPSKAQYERALQTIENVNQDIINLSSYFESSTGTSGRNHKGNNGKVDATAETVAQTRSANRTKHPGLTNFEYSEVYAEKEKLERAKETVRLYELYNSTEQEVVNAQKKQNKLLSEQNDEVRVTSTLNVPVDIQKGYNQFWNNGEGTDKEKVSFASDDELKAAAKATQQVIDALDKQQKMTDAEIEDAINIRLQKWVELYQTRAAELRDSVAKMQESGRSYTTRTIDENLERAFQYESLADFYANPQEFLSKQSEDMQRVYLDFIETRIQELNKEIGDAVLWANKSSGKTRSGFEKLVIDLTETKNVYSSLLERNDLSGIQNVYIEWLTDKRDSLKEEIEKDGKNRSLREEYIRFSNDLYQAIKSKWFNIDIYNERRSQIRNDIVKDGKTSSEFVRERMGRILEEQEARQTGNRVAIVKDVAKIERDQNKESLAAAQEKLAIKRQELETEQQILETIKTEQENNNATLAEVSKNPSSRKYEDVSDYEYLQAITSKDGRTKKRTERLKKEAFANANFASLLGWYEDQIQSAIPVVERIRKAESELVKLENTPDNQNRIQLLNNTISTAESELLKIFNNDTNIASLQKSVINQVTLYEKERSIQEATVKEKTSEIQSIRDMLALLEQQQDFLEKTTTRQGGIKKSAKNYLKSLQQYSKENVMPALMRKEFNDGNISEDEYNRYKSNPNGYQFSKELTDKYERYIQVLLSQDIESARNIVKYNTDAIKNLASSAGITLKSIPETAQELISVLSEAKNVALSKLSTIPDTKEMLMSGVNSFANSENVSNFFNSSDYINIVNQIRQEEIELIKLQTWRVDEIKQNFEEEQALVDEQIGLYKQSITQLQRAKRSDIVEKYTKQRDEAVKILSSRGYTFSGKDVFAPADIDEPNQLQTVMRPILERQAAISELQKNISNLLSQQEKGIIVGGKTIGSYEDLQNLIEEVKSSLTNVLVTLNKETSKGSLADRAIISKSSNDASSLIRLLLALSPNITLSKNVKSFIDSDYASRNPQITNAVNQKGEIATAQQYHKNRVSELNEEIKELETTIAHLEGYLNETDEDRQKRLQTIADEKKNLQQSVDAEDELLNARRAALEGIVSFIPEMQKDAEPFTTTDQVLAKATKYAGMTEDQAQITKQLNALIGSRSKNTNAIEQLQKEAKDLGLLISKKGYAYKENTPSLNQIRYAFENDALGNYNTNSIFASLIGKAFDVKDHTVQIASISNTSGLALDSTVREIINLLKSNKYFRNYNNQSSSKQNIYDRAKELGSQYKHAQSSAEKKSIVETAIKEGLHVIGTKNGKTFFSPKLYNNQTDKTKEFANVLGIATDAVKKNTEATSENTGKKKQNNGITFKTYDELVNVDRSNYAGWQKSANALVKNGNMSDEQIAEIQRIGEELNYEIVKTGEELNSFYFKRKAVSKNVESAEAEEANTKQKVAQATREVAEAEKTESQSRFHAVRGKEFNGYEIINPNSDDELNSLNDELSNVKQIISSIIEQIKNGDFDSDDDNDSSEQLALEQTQLLILSAIQNLTTNGIRVSDTSAKQSSIELTTPHINIEDYKLQLEQATEDAYSNVDSDELIANYKKALGIYNRSKKEETREKWNSELSAISSSLQDRGYTLVDGQWKSVLETVTGVDKEIIDVIKRAKELGMSIPVDQFTDIKKTITTTGKILYQFSNKYGSFTLNEKGQSPDKDAKYTARSVSKLSTGYTDSLRLMKQVERQTDRMSRIANYRSAMFGDKAENVSAAQSLLRELNNVRENGIEKSGLSIDEVRRKLQSLMQLVSTFDRKTTSERVWNIEDDEQLKVDARKELLKQLAAEEAEGTIQNEHFAKSGTQMAYEVRTADDVIQSFTITLNKEGEAVRELVNETPYVSNFTKAMQAFQGKFLELSRYMASSFSIYRLVSFFRSGIQVVRDLDEAMTELKKVSEDASSALENFKFQSFEVAKQVGSTGSAIIQSAADWERLGYNIKEATELAKNSALYANVGDMDIDTATEHMVSTLQAFNIAAEDSISIVDKFNKIGNSYPITSQGIGEGLENSASALVAANNSIDEAIALITAGNVVAQDPAAVGNAIKVMSLRIRGAKSDLEDMGEDTEDLASSTSKLRQELLALTGVDLMLNENTYKSTYQILVEIAEVWDQLSDISQANVLEKIAGKTRASVVAGLLQNEETLKNVLNDSVNAVGSAAEENEIYLDSINGKIQILTNSWQELWNNGLSSEVIKGVVDLGNAAVTCADKVGLIGSALGIVFSASGIKNIAKLAIETVKYGRAVNDVAQKAAEAAAGAAKFNLQLTAVMGVITILIAVIVKLSTSIREFEQAAKDASDALSEATEALKEYREESIKLNKVINNETSSINESKEARADLLKMQDELIEKYGKEAETVRLISQAINGEAEAFERLEMLQYQQTKNEFNKTSGNGTIDWFARWTASGKVANTNFEAAIDAMERPGLLSFYNTILQSEEEVKKLQDAFEFIDDKSASNGLMLSGNAYNQKEQIEQIIEFAKNNNFSKSVIKEYQKIYDSLDNIISKYGDLYDQYIKYEKIWSNPQLKKQIDATGEAFSDYQESLISGNENEIKSAGRILTEELNKAIALANGDESIIEYINSLYPAAQQTIDKWNLKFDLDDDSSIKSILEVFGNSYEKIKEFNVEASNNAELTEAYKELEKYVEGTTLSVEDLLEVLVELGYIEDGVIEAFRKKYPDLVGQLSEEEIKVAASINISTTKADIQSQVDEITGMKGVDILAQPKVDWKTMNAAGWDTEPGSYSTINTSTFSNEAGDIAINVTPILPDGTVLTPEQLEEYATEILETEEDKYGIQIGVRYVGSDAIEKATSDAERLHELSELYYSTNEELILSKAKGVDVTLREASANVDALSSIQALAEGFDQLDSIYLDVLNKEDFDWSSILNNDSFESTFGKLDGATAAYKEAYSSFIETITKSPDDIAKCQEAFNALATEYVYNSGALDDVTESTKAASVAMLREMGIVNAEEVVTAALNAEKQVQTNVNDVLIDNGYDFLTITAAQIQELIDEGQITQDTAEYIAYYALKKQLANNSTLDTSSDINALNGLVKALGGTTEALIAYSNIKSQIDVLQQKFSSGTISAYDYSSQYALLSKQLASAQKDAQQEIDAALELGENRTNEYKKSVYEKPIIEYDGGKSTKDYLKDQSESFDEIIDYFERRITVLNNSIELLNSNIETLEGSTAKNQLLNGQKSLYEEEVRNYEDAAKMYQEMANIYLAKLPSDVAEKIKSGAVSLQEFVGEANEDVVDAINEYQTWADKVADCNQQLAELKKTLAQLELSKFNNIVEDYTNVTDIRQNSIDLIDKQISLFQEAGELVGKAFYEAQREQTQKQIGDLNKEKVELVAQMNSALASGNVDVGSEEWLEMVSQLTDVENSIYDCQQAIESFDNAILELHTEVFERIIGYSSDLRSEIDDLVTLIGDDEDVATTDNVWTDSGLTKLALYASQYETAKKEVADYSEEIHVLNEEYAAGKYSATEYADRLGELYQAQRDSAKSAEDSLSAILELNKARVDIVVEGIEKEIDAYEELIEEQKKALQSEKDLHDYENSLKESTDEINAIQRQIAALQGDTTAAAQAKIAKLQEELAKAQDTLTEKVYDHEIETAENALDEQLETYKDERQAEIDALNESLENEEQIYADSFAAIKNNAATVAQELETLALEHGVTISSILTDAWESGSDAIANYGVVLTEQSSALIGQLNLVENETWQLQEQANQTAETIAYAFSAKADGLVGELEGSYVATSNLNEAAVSLQNSFVSALERGYDISSILSNLNSVKDAADAAKDSLDKLKDTPVTTDSSKQNIAEYAKYLWTSTGLSESEIKKELKAKGYSDEQISNILKALKSVSRPSFAKYAKGVHNLTADELAWTQEFGNEAILSPTRNAVLTPLRSGDSVLTQGMTENLWKFANNPSDFLSKLTVTPNVPGNRESSKSLTIGNVLTVNGNVDSNNIDEIKQYTTKAITAAFNKLNAGLH